MNNGENERNLIYNLSLTLIGWVVIYNMKNATWAFVLCAALILRALYMYVRDKYN